MRCGKSLCVPVPLVNTTLLDSQVVNTVVVIYAVSKEKDTEQLPR